MSQEKDRAVRLKDFEIRGEQRQLVLPSGEALGDYIEVHPFSDDVDALRELDWSAERCRAVDCYWKIDRDVLFVQFWSRSGPGERGPGYYARVDETRPTYLVVGVVLPRPQVSRVQAEAALKELAVGGLTTMSQREFAIQFGLDAGLKPIKLAQ